MIEVNLLPWREQREMARALRFKRLGLLGLVMAMSLLGLYIMKLINLQSDQAQSNYELQQRLAQLRLESEEVASLIGQSGVIQTHIDSMTGLWNTRETVVDVLDELVEELPGGVAYQSIVREGGRIAIFGLASSNDRVSALMNSLKQSPWCLGVALKVINNLGHPIGDKSVKVSQFQLILNIEEEVLLDDEKTSSG